MCMIFREKFGPEVDQSKFFGPEVDPSKFSRNQDSTRTFLKGSRPDLHPKKEIWPSPKKCKWYDLCFAISYMWLCTEFAFQSNCEFFYSRELNRKVNWWSFFMRKEHICFYNGMKNWSCFNLNFPLEISLMYTFFCIKRINKWK